MDTPNFRDRLEFLIMINIFLIGIGTGTDLIFSFFHFFRVCVFLFKNSIELIFFDNRKDGYELIVSLFTTKWIFDELLNEYWIQNLTEPKLWTGDLKWEVRILAWKNNYLIELPQQIVHLWSILTMNFYPLYCHQLKSIEIDSQILVRPYFWIVFCSLFFVYYLVFLFWKMNHNLNQVFLLCEWRTKRNKIKPCKIPNLSSTLYLYFEKWFIHSISIEYRKWFDNDECLSV